MSTDGKPCINANASDLVHLGSYLASARKAAGLSVSQVGDAIRVAPDKIEALEAGRLEELPRAPFVRGIIVAYGQVVKLDKEELNLKVSEVLGSNPNRDLSQIREPADSELTHIEKPTFYITTQKIIGCLLIIGMLGGVWIGLGYVNKWSQQTVDENLTEPSSLVSPEQHPVASKHTLIVRSKVPNFIKFLEGTQESHSQDGLIRTFVGPEREFKKEDITVPHAVLWGLYPRALEVYVNGQQIDLQWKGQMASLNMSSQSSSESSALP